VLTIVVDVNPIAPTLEKIGVVFPAIFIFLNIVNYAKFQPWAVFMTDPNAIDELPPTKENAVAAYVAVTACATKVAVLNEPPPTKENAVAAYVAVLAFRA
jgi:hypothetical protein